MAARPSNKEQDSFPPVLAVLSSDGASRLAAAFKVLVEECWLDWRVDDLRPYTRSQAADVMCADTWTGLVLDGDFADLARQGVQVRAASVQLSGGADCLFRLKGQTVALHLFGHACIEHLKRLGYSVAGKRVVVCGSSPRSMGLLASAALWGAKRLVLLDETPKKAQAALNLYLARAKRLSYATFELEPEEGQVTLRQAYEDPDYLFGSYTTSVQELAAADFVLAAGVEPFDTSAVIPEQAWGNQVLAYHAGSNFADSQFAHAAKAAGISVPDGRGTIAALAAEAMVSFMHTVGRYPSLSADDMFAHAASALGMPRLGN